MGWDFLDCKVCHVNSMANHWSREAEHKFTLCARCEAALKNLKQCKDCGENVGIDHYKMVPVDPSMTYWGRGRIEEIICPKRKA